MAGAAVNIKKYTIDEYFELDSKSESKLEYYNGIIREMSGGTDIHNEIALKIGAAILYLLEKKAFKVYNSDMRIHVPSLNTFVYPDAVVVCKKPEFYQGRRDIITNPLLIVEVMSPSTQHYDRGSKFFEYRSISTFREYVLVEQTAPEISVFYREEEDLWRERKATGMDAALYLQSVDCNLPLKKVFRGVEFDE